MVPPPYPPAGEEEVRLVRRSGGLSCPDRRDASRSERLGASPLTRRVWWSPSAGREAAGGPAALHFHWRPASRLPPPLPLPCPPWHAGAGASRPIALPPAPASPRQRRAACRRRPCRRRRLPPSPPALCLARLAAAPLPLQLLDYEEADEEATAAEAAKEGAQVQPRRG